MEEENNASFSLRRGTGDLMATSQQQHYEARGFRDDGLWRRLLTRAQQGTSNHNFFLVNVVEGCLHTDLFCKLGLPTVFMHHHYKSLSEHVILEGPDGKRWPTMLGLQLDSQPCLMHGWKEFAASYDLELKDQVVLLLFESSHFLVQVYDANDRVKRRRVIPPPPQNIKYDRSEDVRAALNQPQSMRFARDEDFRLFNLPQKMKYARNEDGRAGNQPPNMSCARSEDWRAGNQPPNMSCARSEDWRAGNQPQNMSYVRSEDMRAPQNMSFARSEDLRAVNQSQIMDYARSEDRNAVSQVNTPVRQSISLSVHGCNPRATKPTKAHGEISPCRYIQISDSSEEENEDEDQEARPPSISFPDPSQKQDASDGTKAGGSGNKMTLRSAAKAAADLVTLTKDDAILNPPSSPESMVVLKRSRRLQRKSGDYEGDDLGRATTNILRRKLYKLSSGVSPTGVNESAVPPPKEPATPTKETATPPPKEPSVPPNEPAVSPKEPAVPPEEPVAPPRKEPVTASVSLSPSENEKRKPVEEASKRAVAAHNCGDVMYYRFLCRECDPNLWKPCSSRCRGCG